MRAGHQNSLGDSGSWTWAFSTSRLNSSMLNLLEVHRRLQLSSTEINYHRQHHLLLQSQSTLQLVFTNTHWVRITESLPNQNTWMHNQFPPRRERTNYAQQTDVTSLNPVQERVQTLLRAWKFQNLYSTVPERFPTQQNSSLLELPSIPSSVAYFSC